MLWDLVLGNAASYIYCKGCSLYPLQLFLHESWAVKYIITRKWLVSKYNEDYSCKGCFRWHKTDFQKQMHRMRSS